MSASVEGKAETSDEERRCPWPFRSRWRIEGCLFTSTPLHIGSGEASDHPDPDSEDVEPEVAAILRYVNGMPSITGATLKGSLRAWAHRCGLAEGVIDNLLGHGPINDDDQGHGGKAEFHDCPLHITRTGETPLPFWDDARQSYIETQNSIDRVTRAAAHQHLIHLECVPAGVGFQVVVTGMMDSDEIQLLLTLLEGFNHDRDPVVLGADTASGKGRLHWEPGMIQCLDSNQVADWIRRHDRGMVEHQLPELKPDIRLELLEAARRSVEAINPKDVLRFDVTLRFDGLFLVNDPPGSKEKDVAEENRPPDARPRADEMNRAILPAKSFRGAVRSQAERIIRTLGGHACDPSDSQNCCKGIETREAKEANLCLACRLFGAPGWRTPLEISDFHLLEGEHEYDMILQEFIAIDRFTGGGKDGAKFNALAICRPVYTGTITVDLARIRRGKNDGGPDWEPGLLALVLRDLMEGDIAFGHRSAKDYGNCTAEIAQWGDERFRQMASSGLDAFRRKIEAQTGKTCGDAA